MVDVIDDTQPVTINVWICEDFTTESECLAHGCFWWDNSCHPASKPEGVADITDVIFPQSVQSGAPFNITYTITNLGAADTLWAGLYDLSDNPIAGFWSEPFAAGEIKVKTIDFPNGITTPLESFIRAGHVEE